MSAISKPRTNIFAAIGSLFSSGIDVEENEDIKLPEELSDALKSLANKEAKVEETINVASNSSKRGGFAKKINPNTEKAMRAIHKEVEQKVSEDRERD